MNSVEKVKDGLLKFFEEDGTLKDQEYFIDSIMLTIQNTEYLYKWAMDTQRRTHTIVYEGLIELLKEEIGEPVTSPQLKSAFKSLGVNFKEVLKPVVDEVDEWRKTTLGESKEITEAKDTDYIIVKDTNEGTLYMNDKSSSFDKKQAKIYNSEEEANEALSNYRENKANTDGDEFRVERLNDFKEKLEGTEIECNKEDLVEDVNIAKVIDQINELEAELEMLQNDKEVDQAEVKKVKDKIYRLSRKINEAKMIRDLNEATIKNEEVDKSNLEDIVKILKDSGIKSEKVLELMSKDILKDLKSNYDKNCSDENGIFPGAVIVDAIQKKIEQITHKKPQLKFGECLKDSIEPVEQIKEECDCNIEDENNNLEEDQVKRLYADSNKEMEEQEEENIIDESLTSGELLKRELPIYINTNQGYMEVSIDEDPQKPEDYDEGYITGWDKGQDPAYDAEQELRYKEATEAYNEGKVYQLRQVVDDIIYTICYGNKELDETLKQLNASIVNIDELMR